MAYTIQHIAAILQTTVSVSATTEIEQLLIDSRKIVFPQTSLFFAISGPRRDGHHFIKEVYERGVRNFVVLEGFDARLFSDANFLQVPNVLTALQQLAAHHRKQFQIPVIGITGSNGKTIVKEWLYQLLQHEYSIVRSPRSYNSQLGVPLSVWQMQPHHTLAIFEAGISAVGEMEKLASIIQPTMGVLTNIGDAHNEGFINSRQKAIEKAKLFAGADIIFFGREVLQQALHPDNEDKGLYKEGTLFFRGVGKPEQHFK